jgi:hypothetical protein
MKPEMKVRVQLKGGILGIGILLKKTLEDVVSEIFSGE